jgi:ABC-type multidrug transport system fused ATPase/permease subunit
MAANLPQLQSVRDFGAERHEARNEFKKKNEDSQTRMPEWLCKYCYVLG